MNTQTVRRPPVIRPLGTVSEVKVAPCAPDNSAHPKGSRTWNYVMQSPMQVGFGRRMLARRVRGEEVGNHFHPRVENKNPEIFVLLHGDIEFWFKDVFGNERVEHISVDAASTNPAMVTLPPYVLHGIRVLSEWALFEEFQTGPFDPEVNYTAEEFDHFVRSQHIRGD